MQTLILKSENKKALNAIQNLARVLDISFSMKNNVEGSGSEVENRVKIIKAKRKFNPKDMAGSLTDLKLEDASIIRKKAWTRKKAAY